MSELSAERVAWLRENRPLCPFAGDYLKMLQRNGVVAIEDYFGECHDIAGLLEDELPCYLEQPVRLIANERLAQ